MHSDYYSLDNGRQAISYIYEYHLGFSYGNTFKYLVRAGRKEEGASAEKDINKALVYITSAKDEYGFIRRLFMKVFNSFTFNDESQFAEHHLREVLCSIIKFESPLKIAKKIVKYAKWRGINVKPEFEKYGE